MSGEHFLRITHALLRSQTTLAAVRALHGSSERTAVEGLVELVHRHRTAGEAVAAIDALGASTNPIVGDALCAALDSPHSSVRLAAIQDLQRRRLSRGNRSLGCILRTEESWPVRRAALHALATEPGPERWRVLDGATDPHWRSRHALIRVLLHWGESVCQRQEIDQRLTRLGTNARVQGVRAYLRYRWSGDKLEASGGPDELHTWTTWPFWDWDPAVLLRNLERMTEKGRRAALDEMPFLLRHTDERIRTLAGKCLRDWGQVRHLASVVGLLDEPRQDGVGNAVKLLSELDEDRREDLALFLLGASEATAGQLAWALDQVGQALPADGLHSTLARLGRQAASQPLPIRRALARLGSRWEHPLADEWFEVLLADRDPGVQCESLRTMTRRRRPPLDPAVLQRLLDSEDGGLRAETVTAAVRQEYGSSLLDPLVSDPEMRVRLRLAQELAGREDSWSIDTIARLQADPHPHVRAAALTPSRAAELIREPARETSWHVLATAARLARIPLWKLEPSPPWRPSPVVPNTTEPLRLRSIAAHPARCLGPGQLAVAPLGISGHYGLPMHGFCRAYEAGVNLMFWEPNYRTMTEFYAQIGPSIRGAIHLLAGTFEADGRRIRRDAECVLRSLKIEIIDMLLLFWVQSWQRITPDVREALEQLKAEGKIAAFGLSTHSRSLAVEALDTGWNPVMVRHSAAHRGAEQEVFPRAARCGASLITFSNTCYGRLLQPHNGMAPPPAADCYRYTLIQPGVRACLSAPASLAQLEDNLAALRDPVLPEERRNYLLDFGEKLYEEETVFRKCVRNVS
ncbi:MAG TPA: aldo/keto reductase [Gemmataceae bacterium]|nr:aldo/keto reductase [Gemmataceae bacterium]